MTQPSLLGHARPWQWMRRHEVGLGGSWLEQSPFSPQSGWSMLADFGRKGSREWDQPESLGEMYPACRCPHGCACRVQPSPSGQSSRGPGFSNPGHRRTRAEQEKGKQHPLPPTAVPASIQIQLRGFSGPDAVCPPNNLQLISLPTPCPGSS